MEESPVGMRSLVVREDRQIPQPINFEEMAKRGRQLAAALEARRAEIKGGESERAQRKGRLKVIDGNIDKLRAAVISGYEPVAVCVEEWAEHDRGEVLTIRKDTGEVIARRPMTTEERQLPIDFVSPEDPAMPKFGDGAQSGGDVDPGKDNPAGPAV